MASHLEDANDRQTKVLEKEERMNLKYLRDSLYKYNEKLLGVHDDKSPKCGGHEEMKNSKLRQLENGHGADKEGNASSRRLPSHPGQKFDRFHQDETPTLGSFADGSRHGMSKHLWDLWTLSQDVVSDKQRNAKSCTPPMDVDVPTKPKTDALHVLEDGTKVVGRSQPGKRHVEVVVFKDPLKRKKTCFLDRPGQLDEDGRMKTDKTERQGSFNFAKAKIEIERFAITGYSKEKQRECERNRAILLGARPPKRQYLNYKVYQEMMKKKKLEEEIVKNQMQQTDPRLLKINKKGKPAAKNGRKQTSRKNKLGNGGMLGKFNGGMLVLSTQDMDHVKKRRVHQ
uniref:uncharacterized protein C1orf131 homolog isoform X1 n=2 Tax=Myxine glutinosa TaxID=7769 RepID=UPI00358E29E4